VIFWKSQTSGENHFGAWALSFGNSWDSRSSRKETKRERRIYLTYGIIAAGGLLILMGSLLVTAFRYLGDGSQPMILAVPVTAGLMIRGHRGSCAPLQERRIPTSPAMMI
jgi:hypothetical protein